MFVFGFRRVGAAEMKESRKEVSGNMMKCCLSSVGGVHSVERKTWHANLRKKVLLSERMLILLVAN